jgi:hypothetical protein
MTPIPTPWPFPTHNGRPVPHQPFDHKRAAKDGLRRAMLKSAGVAKSAPFDPYSLPEAPF